MKEEGLVASCGFSRFVFSLSFFPFRVLRFYIHDHDHIIIRAIYLDPLSSFYTAFDDLIAIDRAVLERLMRERLERKLELEFEVEELRDGADPIRCPKGWEDGVSRFEEGSRSTRLSLDLLRLVSRGLLRES